MNLLLLLVPKICAPLEFLDFANGVAEIAADRVFLVHDSHDVPAFTPAFRAIDQVPGHDRMLAEAILVAALAMSRAGLSEVHSGGLAVPFWHWYVCIPFCDFARMERNQNGR